MTPRKRRNGRLGDRNLVLVGFMGSGKTTLGQAVARRLGRPFVDTDAWVEEQAGCSVAELFRTRGEEAFRALERRAVAEAASRTGQVVATGGGALADPENLRRLRATGVLVHLTAAPEVLLERARRAPGARPLLDVPDPETRVRELLEARRGVYAEADLQLDTGCLTVDQAVEELLRLVAAEDSPPGAEWRDGSEGPPAAGSQRRTGAGGGPRVRRVRVELGERSYPVVIGAGILEGLGRAAAAAVPGRTALVVADEAVAESWAARAAASLRQAGFRASVARVPSGEGSKSLREAERLYDAAVEAGLDRQGCVVAVGGGVVGDLAGFVAATFMRGVALVQVPTTLLAQVDASVGGKVAVNHPRGKNLIGAFHQPSLVWADVETLTTLPEGELRSGLAEVVKHGVVADALYLARVRRRAAELAERQPAALIDAVAGSVRIKARLVAADEREVSGLRSHLNFGHTVGHALEAVTGYGLLRHGEAVAIGMVAAGRLALGRGLWSEAWQRELVGLLESLGLPTTIPGLDVARIVSALRLDKKAREGRVRWVLPVRPGQVVVRDDVPPSDVERVLREMGARDS